MEFRYFEDLSPGDKFVSPGRTITEADVSIFAGLSGDYNILHTDEEYMKKSEFGTRIAHGLLGTIIQTGLGQRAVFPPAKTLAFLGIEEWRFLKPILIGDTIKVHLSVDSKRETKKPDRGIIRWRRRLRNQRDELAQEGVTVSMVYRKPAG